MKGIHQCDSVTHPQEMIRVHDPRFLVFSEPKVAHHELPRFAFSIGFHSWLHGGEGNLYIWIPWKHDIQVERYLLQRNQSRLLSFFSLIDNFLLLVFMRVVRNV